MYIVTIDDHRRITGYVTPRLPIENLSEIQSDPNRCLIAKGELQRVHITEEMFNRTYHLYSVTTDGRLTLGRPKI